MKKFTLLAFMMLLSCIMTPKSHAEGTTDTETIVLTSFYDGNGSTFGGWGDGTFSNVDEDGKPCLKFTNEVAKELDWDIMACISASFAEGTEYTIEFDVKGNPATFDWYFQHSDGFQGRGHTDKFNVTPEWTHVSIKGTPIGTNGADSLLLLLGKYVGTLYFSNVVITYQKPTQAETPEPEEVNEGIIYSALGESSNVYIPGGEILRVNDEYYNSLWLGGSECDIDIIYNGLTITPNKPYKLSFDILGTPSEDNDNQYVKIRYGDVAIHTSSFGITDNWQRVTAEIKSENSNLMFFSLHFGKQYKGRIYITNIFVYDALDSPELPELPTADVTRYPLFVNLAIPVAIGCNQPITALTVPETASPELLTWSSKNEDIATVDENGIVTGVSKGIATITATTTTWNQSSIFIDVYEPESVPVAVSSITIDPMVIDKAVVGDKIQLEATVLPENADDKTVTWSSSNENAATVDADGLVTITAPGTAVITATANDGSGVKGVCLISGLSGLDNVTYTSAADKKDVYSVDGKLIMRSATRDDLNRLSPGIYLIGDQKIAIR